MYISAYYFGQSMVDDALDRSDTRRLQITGGSTYIVSLPKRWVVQHGLVAKDEVRIEWRPSGTLRIIPEGSSVRKRREVEILLDELPEVVILDHLIAAYLAGAQLIRIQTMTGFTRDHRRIFRKFVQSTRGVEIANESDRIIEMVTLLSPSEMPIHSSINRMYLLISSQIRDIVEVLSGGTNRFSMIRQSEREKSMHFASSSSDKSAKSSNHQELKIRWEPRDGRRLKLAILFVPSSVWVTTRTTCPSS